MREEIANTIIPKDWGKITLELNGCCWNMCIYKDTLKNPDDIKTIMLGWFGFQKYFKNEFTDLRINILLSTIEKEYKPNENINIDLPKHWSTIELTATYEDRNYGSIEIHKYDLMSCGVNEIKNKIKKMEEMLKLEKDSPVETFTLRIEQDEIEKEVKLR